MTRGSSAVAFAQCQWKYLIKGIPPVMAQWLKSRYNVDVQCGAAVSIVYWPWKMFVELCVAVGQVACDET